jgi:hypothetical protein
VGRKVALAGANLSILELAEFSIFLFLICFRYASELVLINIDHFQWDLNSEHKPNPHSVDGKIQTTAPLAIIYLYRLLPIMHADKSQRRNYGGGAAGQIQPQSFR